MCKWSVNQLSRKGAVLFAGIAAVAAITWVIYGMLANGQGWSEHGQRIEVTPNEAHIVTFNSAPIDSQLQVGEHADQIVVRDWSGGIAFSRRTRKGTWVECLDVAAEFPLRIVYGLENRVIEWSCSDEGTERTLTTHGGRVYDLDVSNDGRYVVSSGHDGVNDITFGGDVRVVELSTLQVVAQFEQERTATCVAFAPDGRRIALGNTTGSIAVITWRDDSIEMELEHTHSHQLPDVSEVLFAPDSTWLASGGRDSVIVWDLSSAGSEVVRLRVPGRVIRAIAISSDGSRLATVKGGDVVVVYESTTWDVVDMYEHRGVTDVWLSGDGRKVCSVGGGELKVRSESGQR